MTNMCDNQLHGTASVGRYRGFFVNNGMMVIHIYILPAVDAWSEKY